MQVAPQAIDSATVIADLMRPLLASACASVFALACCGEATAQRRAPGDDSPLTETERIRHTLSRFAFGPVPGQIEAIRAQGLDAWFEAQLAADEASDAGSSLLVDRLAELPAIALSGKELIERYRNPERANRPKRGADRDVQDAVVYRALFSPSQVKEVACDFFRNHFNVDADKGDVQYLLPDWEREVIRAEALGDFGAMLEKSAKHPAMLIYLDNSVSRRPLSKGELKNVEVTARVRTRSKARGAEAAAIASQRGLNENYARELLELHTLGVDRYYTQRDVIEVAKILTGWTVALDAETHVGFHFDGGRHVRGEKWFLNSRIRASTGSAVEEGEELIRRLVQHKGTSEFVSWKLCRHLVSDDPPEAMVKRVAAVFRRTKGRMSAVLQAIYDDREFFAPQHFQSKFKRPLEFVVSALRVTGARVDSVTGVQQLLTELGEPTYECEDPTGYFDQAEAWNDPGIMAVRWRFALDLAAGRFKGVKIPKSFFADLHPRIHRAWRDQLAEKILPAGMSPRTAAVIDGRIKKYLDDHPKPKRERLGALIAGLLIGSPEFQRQ